MINLSKLNKPIFKMPTLLPQQKLCNLSCISKTAGDITINNSTIGNGYNTFLATILKKTGEKLGTDTFGVYPETEKIIDFNMEVNPNLRQKGLFLGELLRLKSIIELIENNFKTIELISKNSAIFFHAKYKFVPDITSFTQRDYTLNTIAQNKNQDFIELSEKAKDFIKKLQANPTSEEQRDICKQTSKLCTEYIRQVLAKGKDEYKKNPFNFPIYMVLSKENVAHNKDFFNNLFSKHGIDYKI